MKRGVNGHAQIVFPVRIQPGTQVGRWQATVDGATNPVIIEFASALDLVLWLEAFEGGRVPPQLGLR